MRQSGSRIVSKAHTTNNSMARSRGHKHRFGSRAYSVRGYPYRDDRGGRSNFLRHDFQARMTHSVQRNRDKVNMHERKPGDETCNICVMNRHWARVCRTPQHVVDCYQASRDNKENGIKEHVTEASGPLTIVEANRSKVIPIQGRRSFQVSDFVKGTGSKKKRQIQRLMVPTGGSLLGLRIVLLYPNISIVYTMQLISLGGYILEVQYYSVLFQDYVYGIMVLSLSDDIFLRLSLIMLMIFLVLRYYLSRMIHSRD